MARSFDLVDDKLYEADFFQEKLVATDRNLIEARYYFSAFVAAARSVTFALQAVMSGIEGFDDWYRTKQEVLKGDKTAKFFHKARTESQHIGVNPLNGDIRSFIESRGSSKRYFFSVNGIGPIPNAPDGDAVAACREYLVSLVALIFECYEQFGSVIDPDKYYTLQNLERLGLSIEDVEESLGFLRGWTYVSAGYDEERVKALRRSVPGTQIDGLFVKYLKWNRASNDSMA
jgi:hypothetical protein